MRVAFTSDLHVDVTPQNAAIVPDIASRVLALDPDVFIVAGDAANSLYRLDTTLGAFEKLRCTRFFVPGNHDLWAESRRAVRKGKDSGFKHDEAIPSVCKRRGFAYLPGAPVIVDGLGIVGSAGWYDFSFRPRALDHIYSRSDYARGELHHPRYPTGVWNDCREVVWLLDRNGASRRRRDPVSLFEALFDRFESDLKAVLSQVKRLLVVLHTNPFIECLAPRDLPDPFDAYAGASRLGATLASVAASIPTVCVCGHRHTPLDISVQGVRVVRSPTGYLDGFRGDLSAHSERCVGLIEL